MNVLVFKIDNIYEGRIKVGIYDLKVLICYLFNKYFLDINKV